MRKLLIASAVLAFSTAGSAEPRAAATTATAAAAAPSTAVVRTNNNFETQKARLRANVKPEQLAKLKVPARQTLEAAGKKTSTTADLLAVARRSVIGAMGDAPAVDIDTLVALVMMQAEEDAREDLRSTLESMKAVTDAKACQRDTKCLEQLASKGEASKQAAERATNDLKGNLDSLGDLGETLSLRLQMAMDRLTKMTSTLSNLLKKSSDIAGTLTQNLK
jgi:hypothetical protein